MKDKLLKIIKHYGAVNQRKKLCEEFMELQDELYFAYEIGGENADKLISEIADVLVLIFQFVVEYGFDTTDIENEMRFKIQRQLDRISEKE